VKVQKIIAFVVGSKSARKLGSDGRKPSISPIIGGKEVYIPGGGVDLEKLRHNVKSLSGL